MAMKKKKTPSKKVEPNDNVTVKAAYGMSVFCILLFALVRVASVYGLKGYRIPIRDALLPVTIVSAVLAVGSIVAWFKTRKTKEQLSFLCMAGFALFAMAAFTALVLREMWLAFLTPLYVFYVGLLVIFLIFLLYPNDFFIMTKINFYLIAAFYAVSKSFMAVTIPVAFLVILAMTCAMVYYCSKHPGKWFGVKITNPMLIYADAGLWAVCLLGTLLLGPLFAYYCVFAVGAVELVLAVYYTVKLA